MINLLPPADKAAYRYAQRNRTLLHWTVASLFSLLGATLLVAGGYGYLTNSIHETTRQNDALTKRLEAEDLAGTQRQITTISNNLKLTVTVLSKEVLFSKLLTQLGTVTPPNVILTNLSIADTQGGINISGQAATIEAATQLQANLADPNNQIFSKADIQDITCATGSSQGANNQNSIYPCSVDIRALFASNNPFLFISNDTKKAAP